MTKKSNVEKLLEKAKKPAKLALAYHPFYEGKVLGARYFIKNILPQSEALAKGIQSEDLSLLALPVNGF